MGAWGAALYDDDSASDLKNTLALLCKVPADGAQLLSHLKHLHGDCAPSDGDAAYFWLVAADQFEKRGIACAEASGNALKIIEGGLDLANQKGRGADDKFLAKRAKVLAELAGRLKSPRPLRERATTGKKPDMVVQTGEVYAFPTMDGRGRLTIRTRRARTDVHVEFADEGPGIAADVLAHSFDPFFTTKPPGQGTGLGLAIAQSIVADHGGRIEVDSRIGNGTIFRVVLPA